MSTNRWRLNTWIGVLFVLMFTAVAVVMLVGQAPFDLLSLVVGGRGAFTREASDAWLATSGPKHLRHSYADMAVNGSDLWDLVAQSQGMLGREDNISGNGNNNNPVPLMALTGALTGATDAVKRQDASLGVCKDFFAVWPGDCVKSFPYMTERMRVLSAQMAVMNATLTFFTTDTTGCMAFAKYPHVVVTKFNATEELLDHGFGREALAAVDRWDKAKFTRISDVLRLCLAHRHRMSYLDTDVHFLHLQKALYEQPYVGAQIYSDNKNAIEITNAAFCLPRPVLSDMMGYQLARILQRGLAQKFFYTELGPSMFHHVRVRAGRGLGWPFCPSLFCNCVPSTHFSGADEPAGGAAVLPEPPRRPRHCAHRQGHHLLWP